MSAEVLAVVLLAVMTVAFYAVLWMSIQNQRRVREMEHRERLAMIERGFIPPPDLEPFFEPGHQRLLSGSRSRSLGVILIGIGVGLILLLTFAAGEPDSGLGVGGALAVLGAAFYVNGMLAARQQPPRRPEVPPAPESRRREPPDVRAPDSDN